MSRKIYATLVFLVIASLGVLAYGQQDAQIQGRVTDTTGAVIPKASVRVVDQLTNTVRTTASNSDGSYTINGLSPSRYKIFVEAKGFKKAESDAITLNVAQKSVLDFKLQVGSDSQTVTVDASGAEINATDASVSTVVDRKFVENMPLNGRSFQALILLAPGTTTGSPVGSSDQYGGQYSVNGMASDANNFMVDGASANNSAYAASGATNAGMLPAATIMGTTQAMLPVDAMEEFRITTSTYSAEYGRQPGAQIQIQSRAGTNQYHGTAYDYLRNTVFDANHWFNDYATTPLPKPPERQNDYGGTFGGPISIPWLFSGKDRAFFFGAYEALRLQVPSGASVSYVPSAGDPEYTTGTYTDPRLENLRANAGGSLKEVMDLYPLPNCNTAIYPQCVDYGNGLQPFLLSGIRFPNSLDSVNVRLDWHPTQWLHTFARYADTTSGRTSYSSPVMGFTTTRNRIYLLGADSVFGTSATNELRLQYSPASELDSAFPYATAKHSLLEQNSLQGGYVYVRIAMTGTATSTTLFDDTSGSVQFQPNVTDSFSWKWRNHLFKAGGDYRQTTAYFVYKWYGENPTISYIYETPEQVYDNSTYYTSVSALKRQDATTKSLGLFVQDEWRVNPRVSLSLGLRWDLNPAPSISGQKVYTYLGDINNPAGMTLAPLGTPLYETDWHDFGPRVGTAITLHDHPGSTTVLRTGAGLYYDGAIPMGNTMGRGYNLGTSNLRYYGQYYGTTQGYPVPPSISGDQTFPALVAPYKLGYLPARNAHPLHAIQWNATIEQELGRGQTLTIGYVGSAGFGIYMEKAYLLSTPVFSPSVVLYENGPGSNYNSLQVTYQRQLQHGLQVLGSYTWAHAIDWSSSDGYGLLPTKRGNADHDLRHNFAAALVYDLPKDYANSFERAVLGGWGADLRVTSRSAFPVSPGGWSYIDPTTGGVFLTVLDYNGKNPYVHKQGIPGGRQYDPSVFSIPASGGIAGNAPRNFLRAFGEFSAETAVRRTFPLTERLNLQFRAEAFNLTNHPNFGALNMTCGTSTAGASCNNPLYGQATSTLSDALGSTLSSNYQTGGPRSLQFALKLQF